MTNSIQAERFRRAAAGFTKVLKSVTAERWDSPSPCPEWSARDIVAHVINESRRTLSTVRGHAPAELHGVGVAPMGSLPPFSPDADPVTAFAEVAAGLVVAIDDPVCLRAEIPTPGGPTAFADTIEWLPEDVLIHTWDLARATGGDEALDADVVAHVHAQMVELGDLLRQPWAFGPEIAPPPGADAQTRFLCFVGRRP